MNYGIDHLGAARYADVILKYHPAGFGFGTIIQLEGFGDAIPVSKKLAAKGTVPLMKGHSLWKDGHNYTRKDFPLMQDRAERWNKLAKLYPDIRFYVSGALEHRFGLSDAQAMAEAIKEAAPNCRYVNVPIQGGAILKGEINEFHGGKLNPGSTYSGFSFDGTNCVDADVTRYKANYASAEYFCFWGLQCNGYRYVPDPKDPHRKPIPREDRKAWPSRDLINSWAYQANPKGNVLLPKSWTGKSHSEPLMDNADNDKRGNRPVYIGPLNVDHLDLVSVASGKVVAKTGHKDGFGPKAWRYYCSDFGYKIAEKAGGDGTVELRAGGGVIGTVNPGFRENDYKNG